MKKYRKQGFTIYLKRDMGTAHRKHLMNQERIQLKQAYLFDQFYRFIKPIKFTEIAYYLRIRDGVKNIVHLNFLLGNPSSRLLPMAIQAVSYYVRPSDGDTNLQLLNQLEEDKNVIIAGLTENHGLRIVYGVDYRGAFNHTITDKVYAMCWDNVFHELKKNYNIQVKTSRDDSLACVSMIKGFRLIDHTSSYTPYIVKG